MWLWREPRLAQLVEPELWMQRALLGRPELQVRVQLELSVRVQLELQVLQAQWERQVWLLRLLSLAQQARLQRLRLARQLRRVLQPLSKLPCSH